MQHSSTSTTKPNMLKSCKRSGAPKTNLLNVNFGRYVKEDLALRKPYLCFSLTKEAINSKCTGRNQRFKLDDDPLIKNGRKKRKSKTKLRGNSVRKVSIKSKNGFDKKNEISADVQKTDQIEMRKVRSRRLYKQEDDVKPKIEPTRPKEDEAIYCDICDKTFKNTLKYSLHSIIHNNDQRYSCHVCKYTTTSKNHFELHIKVHEGKPKYKCESCNKVFATNTRARAHQYLHNCENQFVCEICGKAFMFSKSLNSHRRSRHSETMTEIPLVKYDCTICKQHFTSSSKLKRHQRNKHDMGSIGNSTLCDICGKCLSSKEKLKFHRRIHTGYKPFQCNECPKSFTKKEQLKEHERVHTGEKPFICKYCGKGFTQRSPLRIHERIHTGERPYVCRLCNKGYVSKGVMDTHMKNCEGIPVIID